MISVIIPVYNIESLLPRCIDSVLSQSYKDFELILVDDGSTDRSGVIIDDYANRDSRVKAIHQPNAGVCSARNRGLDEAKGEWITFVDSDDYVTSTYLEDLYNAALVSGSDIVVSGCRYEMNGQPLCRQFSPGRVLVRDMHTLLSDYGFARACCVWGRLFDSRAISGVRFPDGAVSCEDLIFTCRCLLQVDSVYFTDKINYYYEVRSNSLTKVIYPFEYEVISLNELIAVRGKLADAYNVKHIDKYIRPREIIIRIMQSLFNGKYDRKERLSRLRSMQIPYKDMETNNMSIKERIYIYLIKYKMWTIVDMLGKRMFCNPTVKYIQR